MLGHEQGLPSERPVSIQPFPDGVVGDSEQPSDEFVGKAHIEEPYGFGPGVRSVFQNITP